jgi:hypothetical protein
MITSDNETYEVINETLKYCSGVVASNLFHGDDGTEYSAHAIEIMAKVSAAYYPDYNLANVRILLNRWFAAELDSDDHPQMNWSYLAIPPVWDDHIVNKDDE